MSDIPGLYLIGLLYGATVCSMTCLPVLSPYLLATGRGFRDGVLSSVAYLAGKVITYAVLGACAATAGRALFADSEGTLRTIQAATLIVTGLALPFIAGKGCGQKSSVAGRNASLFALGVSTSLVPCLPAASMLVIAAKSGTLLHGSAAGLVYGAGIATSPLLIAGGLFGMIAKTVQVEALRFIPLVRGIAALVMIVMGVRMALA